VHFKLKNNAQNLSLIGLAVLLGSVFRVLFATKFQFFNQAPDQLAWELTLENIVRNGSFSYSYFIHYPHEGGSLFISTVALIFKPFTSNYSLVFAWFLLDAISRFIQLVIVRRYFGKTAFWLYAVFGLFSIPLIMQWSGMPFGLHNLSAVFPFLILPLIHRVHATNTGYFWDGIALGLMIWFYYPNIIIAGVYILYGLFNKKAIKPMLIALFGIIVILLPHLILRYHLDPGFHLSDYSAESIRGEKFDLFDTSNYPNLYKVWLDLFTNASLYSSNSWLSAFQMRTIWYVFSLLGISILVVPVRIKPITKNAIPLIIILLLFATVYALSPFYMSEPDWANYINIRHLTFIFPVFISLSAIGLAQFRITQYVGVLLFTFSIAGYIQAMYQPHNTTVNVRATGWVLANKFGHSPNEMQQIISNSSFSKVELYKGVGWGTAAVLFSGNSVGNSKEAIHQIKTLREGYNNADLKWIDKGIAFAFSNEVTPQLDTNLLQQMPFLIKATN
jgi:hypothetical protein